MTPPTKRRRLRAPRASVKRQRLSPAVRKAQIMDAAARMIVSQGFLPLSVEHLTNNSGVSKALFYAYFHDQYALFNGLLERELSDLLDGGLSLASRVHDLNQAALLCASLYFEHMVRSGPLLHILLADRYMSGHIAPGPLARRNAVLHRMGRMMRSELGLPIAQALAAIGMMLAIPEEAARLVFTGELRTDVGRELCGTLIASSLQALRAPDAALVGLVSADDGT